jgi:hypothetical protein
VFRPTQDTKLKTAKTYYYKIETINKVNGKKGYSGNSAAVSAKTLKTTSITAVKATGSTSVRLEWKAVDGASGYQIYRSTSKDSGYKKVGQVKGKNTKKYEDKTLEAGKTYYYQVRAYKSNSAKNGVASFSKAQKAWTIKQVVFSQITSDSKNQVTLGWKKVSKAQGYDIYRSDESNSGFEKIASISSGSTLTYTDKGVKSGKDDMEENIKFSVVAATPHSQVTLTKAGDKCTNWSGQPGQSINYISCHDNLTFWDKLAISNADDSEADRVKMNKLGSAVLFTSQGVPFMQAGEEMLRSKPNEKSETGFDENSYSSPDATNSIKWDNKGNVMDVYEYYKGLIAFRKAHSALRMTTATAIQNHLTFMTDLDANVVAYTIQGEVQGETAQNIAVIYNGNPDAVTVNLPAGTWDICVNGKKAGCRSLGTAEGSVTVEGISALVLVQEDDTVNKVPAEDA